MNSYANMSNEKLRYELEEFKTILSSAVDSERRVNLLSGIHEFFKSEAEGGEPKKIPRGDEFSELVDDIFNMTRELRNTDSIEKCFKDIDKDCDDYISE